MATLKQLSDGLSKVWKPSKSHKAFYRGGKVEVSSDSSYLVTVNDEKLTLVDLKTGEQCTPFDDSSLENTVEAVNCFCIHPKGDDFVVATQKFSLKHYQLSSKTCIRTIRAHQMPILSMTYDSTGTLVATGSADRSVRVFDIGRGYCTHSFKDHTDIVQSVRFHPDPNRLQLFSTSDDNTIRIYDLIDNKCVAVFRDHVSTPTAISLTPDGYFMASSGRDKVLNFFELRSFIHVKTVPVMDELEGVVILNEEHSRRILDPKGISALVEDNKKKKKGQKSVVVAVADAPLSLSTSHVVITAGNKGVLHLYHIVVKGKDVSSFSCTLLTKISLSSSPIGALSSSSSSSSSSATSLHAITSLQYVSRNGEILAATADHNLCFFAIQPSANVSAPGNGSLVPRRQLVGCNDDILDLIIVPSSSDRAGGTGSRNRSDSAGDGATDKDDEDEEEDNKTSKKAAAESSRSFRVAVITNSPQVRLMDENFNTEVLDGHQDIALAADASPDGRWLASTSKDRTCRIWDLETRTCCAIGEGHADSVGAVCVSQRPATYASKQAFVVTGGSDKILKRWSFSVDDLEERKSLLLKAQTQTASTSSSSSSSLILKDHQPEPLGPLRLVCSHSVRAHDKDVNTVAVSPNDAMIASGSQDKSIRLWRSTDLAPIATLSGHKRGIWRVAFSPVDRCLASCSGDRTVRLWSVVDYSCLRVFEGHTASVLTVRFVNKGMQMVSGAADGLIRLWTIRTGECENTFDEHEDRVWAVAVGPGSGSEGMFLSGGTDSKLLVWRDATEAEEKKRLDEAESTLLIEQQLQNDIRNKRYDKALDAALALGHSNRVLGILTAILEDERGDDFQVEADASSVRPFNFKAEIAEKLDPYVRPLNDEDIEKIVTYMKDWNTNARYSFVSQVLLNSLIRVIRNERLMGIKTVAESLPGLLAYSERHFQRLDRLHQATYVLEYMSSLMHLIPLEGSESPLTSGSATAGGVVSAITSKRSLVDDEADEIVPVLFAPVAKEQSKTPAKSKKRKVDS